MTKNASDKSQSHTDVINLTSTIKKKRCLNDFPPGQFLSYFNPKQTLGSNLYASLIKLLAGFLLDEYDDADLCIYIRENIIGGIKNEAAALDSNDLSNDKPYKYRDEELCFLHYCIEIWKDQKNVRKLQQIEDYMFDYTTYRKLFQHYSATKDYFALRFLLSLSELIPNSDTGTMNKVLSLYEKFITSIDEAACTEKMDIAYIVSTSTGSRVLQGMNDTLPLLIKGMLFLMKSDADELMNYFMERISDIIEPLERSTEMSSESGTKTDQIQMLDFDIKTLKDDINKLQALLDRKDKSHISEILAKKREKEQLYDKCVSNLCTLKKEVGQILIRALSFSTEVFYCIKLFNINVNLSRLDECKQKLLTTSYVASPFVSEAHTNIIKVYEMKLLTLVLGFDANLFSSYSEILLEGVSICTCDASPCSIASALGVMDNIITHINHEFSNDVTASIGKMKMELINMAYSKNADVCFIGICNILKLLLFDPKCTPIDMLCRLLQLTIEKASDLHNPRCFNVLESIIKEFSSLSHKHYKIMLRAFYTLIFLCLSTPSIGDIPNNSLLLKYKIDNLPGLISKVVTKLSISCEILREKEGKMIAAPFFKLTAILALLNEQYKENTDISHLIVCLVNNKSIELATSPSSAYRLYSILNRTKTLKTNKLVQRYINRLMKKYPLIEKKPANISEYCDKKIRLIKEIMKDVNELGNKYMCDDISYVNMGYKEAKNYRKDGNKLPQRRILFDLMPYEFSVRISAQKSIEEYISPKKSKVK